MPEGIASGWWPADGIVERLRRARGDAASGRMGPGRGLAMTRPRLPAEVESRDAGGRAPTRATRVAIAGRARSVRAAVIAPVTARSAAIFPVGDVRATGGVPRTHVRAE